MLNEISISLSQRRYQPIPEHGQWLASVVRGHLAYYAVPGNTDASGGVSHPGRTIRSPRTRLNWTRISRLVHRWLPPAGVMHPSPALRFDVRIRGRSTVR